MAHTRWKAILVGAVVMLGAGRARAQEESAAFGSQGRFALTAERLFGFVYTDRTQTVAGMDQTSHLTAFSLFGNSLGILTMYAQPRLGVDWFPAARLSVGLAAGYAHLSESLDVPANTPVSSPVYTGYLLAPRVGYAVPLSPLVSLWPRLSFTFAHLGLDISNGNTTTTNDTSLYALTLEAPFVFVVAPHLFVSVAPTLELGLGGSQSSTGTSTNVKETDFGVLAGLGGYL
jgi:hypothetical protein